MKSPLILCMKGLVMKSLKILLTLIIFFILTSCQAHQQTASSRTELAFDTVNQITIYKSEGDPSLAMDQAFDYIFEMDEDLSMDHIHSDIYRVNQAAGQSKVKVKKSSLDLIQQSLKIASLSDEKLLQLSIGPLSTLWKESIEKEELAKEEAIQGAQSLVDDQAISIDSKQDKLGLEKEGMMLDPGAVAKGYIADQLALQLEQAGVRSAIINLGGNLKFVGTHPDPFKNWQVGIQNPFGESGDLVASIEVEGGSVVSSGIYQRYFKKGDQIYHHIINPQTGYPFENDLAAITLVCNQSLQADALSTIAMGMGVEKALSFINSIPDVEAVLIDRSQHLHLTDGIEKINLIHEDYQIVQN